MVRFARLVCVLYHSRASMMQTGVQCVDYEYPYRECGTPPHNMKKHTGGYVDNVRTDKEA